ncbi:MAG TPA: hypothetical protein VE988_17925, partial [Gemmataceae bacterium]|nr:hypothetical protein [Gemmataceae bacterium]
MKCVPFATAALLLAALATFADQPANKPMATGLTNPTSVAVLKGKTFVAVAGEIGKDGDGAIMVLDKGKATVFVGNLDDPRGLTTYQNFLFAADKKRIWRIDMKGKAEVFVAENAFPTPPTNLYDVVVDSEQGLNAGSIYACDGGDGPNKGWAIYKITQKKQVTVVTDQKRWPQMQRPGGIVTDGKNHLLIMDRGTGTLYRLTLAGGATEKVADGLGGGDGLAWDVFGRLFISDSKGGKVHVIGRPGQAPVMLAQGFQSPGDLCTDATTKSVLVADIKA